MGNMSISNQQKMAHCEGTVKPYSPFNAEQDAGVLRKAMKGIGTDEKAIIDVLCNRSNSQRLEIKKMFKTAYGKDLIKELKSELSGRFEDLILGLLLTPAEYDATCIRNAISGAGTDEGCLIEILSTRTNAQIMEIKSVYKTLFKRDMEKDLMSDTSGHFKRLLVSLANAGRRETAPVDLAAAKQAATELYRAGEKKLGTDESKFNQILCMNSHAQLQAIFNEYRNVSSKSIEQAIKSEMSGDLEQGMLAVVKVSQNLPGYFADRLHKSMKGAGTKDSTLIRVMVSRCEIDMVQIKQQFQAQYGKSLENWIEGDTSGDYKRALLALCGRR